MPKVELSGTKGEFVALFKFLEEQSIELWGACMSPRWANQYHELKEAIDTMPAEVEGMIPLTDFILFVDASYPPTRYSVDDTRVK